MAYAVGPTFDYCPLARYIFPYDYAIKFPNLVSNVYPAIHLSVTIALAVSIKYNADFLSLRLPDLIVDISEQVIEPFLV